jgi:hypothetical protein
MINLYLCCFFYQFDLICFCVAVRRQSSFFFFRWIEWGWFIIFSIIVFCLAWYSFWMTLFFIDWFIIQLRRNWKKHNRRRSDTIRFRFWFTLYLFPPTTSTQNSFWILIILRWMVFPFLKKKIGFQFSNYWSK